ncbi:Cache 3/Cache 2 fusion domain-containing protein, partial [uncultured Jannaschia sp.]|uniref:methyl-accepting chemotaxis protein n=1 Tax=uncultured Jannaschia sp. TaxID=293347 RepID=UPI00262AFE35
MIRSLRAKILAVVIGATVGTTAILVGQNVWSEAKVSTAERLAGSFNTAAAIVELSVPGVQTERTAEGSMQSLTWNEAPDFSEHSLIDLIGEVTGETATIFVWDDAQGEFVRRSTNIIKPDGTRAVGTVLGAQGAVHPIVASGSTFRGEANILGNNYYTVYFPIRNAAGDIDGILYVGVSKAKLVGEWIVFARKSLMIATIPMLLSIGLGLIFTQALNRGLSQAVDAVRGIARGDLNVDTSTRSLDEIGHLLGEIGKTVVDLRTMGHTAKQIAGGDLRVEVKPRSEADDLGLALRDMVGKLREVISNASVSATYVSEGAANMSSTAEQLSGGSSQQAAAAQEAS